MSTLQTLLLILISTSVCTSQDGSIVVAIEVDPPQISTEEAVEFVCKYSGFNPSNELGFLTWYFQHKKLYTYNSTDHKVNISSEYKGRLIPTTPTRENMTLRLAGATRCDAGCYRCRVHDNNTTLVHEQEGSLLVGAKEANMSLEIHWNKISENSCVSCNTRRPQITVNAGETYTIYCVAFNAPSPETTFSWDTTYQGKSEHYTYTNDDACIPGKGISLEVNLKADMTEPLKFQCLATLPDGQEEKTHAVTVMTGNKVAENGHNMNDGCSCNKTPIVVPLVLLVISNVILAVILIYNCRKKNCSKQKKYQDTQDLGEGEDLTEQNHVETVELDIQTTM